MNTRITKKPTLNGIILKISFLIGIFFIFEISSCNKYSYKDCSLQKLCEEEKYVLTPCTVDNYIEVRYAKSQIVTDLVDSISSLRKSSKKAYLQVDSTPIYLLNPLPIGSSGWRISKEQIFKVLVNRNLDCEHFFTFLNSDTAKNNKVSLFQNEKNIYYGNIVDIHIPDRSTNSSILIDKLREVINCYLKFLNSKSVEIYKSNLCKLDKYQLLRIKKQYPLQIMITIAL